MSSRLMSKSSSKAHGKMVSKSKGGTPAKGQDRPQAGPSHDHWPALPTALVTPRMKRSAPSQSPKKVEAKMACRLSVQQIAGQPQLSQVYLPSALSSVKHYQTLKKKVMSLGQEQDRLSWEVRAAEALYTVTGVQGQRLSVLMQPVHASGIVTLVVPRIQLQELCLKNAGTRLKDQALAQNLIIFGEREREREQMEQSGSTEVATLASMIGGTAQPAPTSTADQQQTDANMDMTEKCDSKATGETGAQQAGSSGSASKDADKA